MNREEFVAGVKESIKDNFVNRFLTFYSNLPGRKPHEKDILIANYIKNLKTEDLEKLKSVIEECVDSTLFSFFCILDHVCFIEGKGAKTTFELYAIKGNEKVLINDPKQEELHVIFKSFIEGDR
jgi:hypothetical protein